MNNLKKDALLDTSLIEQELREEFEKDPLYTQFDLKINQCGQYENIETHRAFQGFQKGFFLTKEKIEQKELELIIESLKLRICIIETGIPTIRANEAKNYERIIQEKLTEDQIELIKELTKLIHKFEKITKSN